VIDLHTHTTASDGRCTPAELVARASAAGVTVLAVTDHDTVAGGDAAADACAAAGIEFVPGIEITAVRDGMDVHVLGYFVDRHSRSSTRSRRAAPPPPRSSAANRRAAGHVRHSSGRRRDHQARLDDGGKAAGPAVDRPGAGGRPLCDQL
jgi:hypothetical protein